MNDNDAILTVESSQVWPELLAKVYAVSASGPDVLTISVYADGEHHISTGISSRGHIYDIGCIFTTDDVRAALELADDIAIGRFNLGAIT